MNLKMLLAFGGILGSQYGGAQYVPLVQSLVAAGIPADYAPLLATLIIVVPGAIGGLGLLLQKSPITPK